MDTRRKIIPAESAPSGCTVVTGYFDVLQADDARELAALSKPVVAVVLPLAGELLRQQARAELAAGLRMIDYVVLAGDAGPDTLIERLRPAQVVRLEAAQAQRLRQLKEHVRNRHTR
jgi:bifunctional ADP-heptose synthase (sugar kinase/adenylyltransferase)